MRAPDGSFFHVWSDGRAQVAGLAADQVYLLNALIDAYQFSADEKYLAEARKLAAIILKNFRADSSGLLVNRETEDASTVIAQSSGERAGVLRHADAVGAGDDGDRDDEARAAHRR